MSVKRNEFCVCMKDREITKLLQCMPKKNSNNKSSRNQTPIDEYRQIKHNNLLRFTNWVVFSLCGLFAFISFVEFFDTIFMVWNSHIYVKHIKIRVDWATIVLTSSSFWLISAYSVALNAYISKQNWILALLIQWFLFYFWI